MVKDGRIQYKRVMRETTKMCISHSIRVDGEGVDWVLQPKRDIEKVNLTIIAKLLWLLVRHCLSTTVADTIVTWGREVLIAAMVVGFEVDFMWLL